MAGHFVMTHIRRGLTRPACEAAIKCLAGGGVENNHSTVVENLLLFLLLLLLVRASV
jgi:hypothetical protein